MNQPTLVKLNITMQTGRTRATILANIALIDALIASLFETAMRSVMNGDVIEYELDTGQTKQRTIFSTTASITTAIEKYEKIRQMYENMLVPRVVRLMDSSNFRKKC